MKYLKHTFLFAILVNMIGVKAYAHDIEVKNADGVTIYYNWIYDWNGNKSELAVSYRGNTSSSYTDEYTGDIVIPESVTYNEINYSVTKIGIHAFLGCTGLVSISIPNSVTSLHAYAFQGCTGLTSINIPNSVTNIDGNAFEGCSSLASITIPEGVKKIENRVFHGCCSLTFIIIPKGVTTIEDGAFCGCRSLTSITLPDGVTTIGDGAFGGCYSLTSITLPESVTTIEDAAFSCCRSLTSITLPDGVTSIGIDAFAGCSGLASINIPNSVTSIGIRAFDGCSSLASINIPNSVTSIGAWAFWGCTSLTSINIPNSVTSIGSNAFDDTGWYNAQTAGILYLDNWLICYKGNPPSGGITIKNGTKGLADSAFQNCTSSLTSINIPNSMISIGDYAFSGCVGLTSVTIPNSVTNIGNSAFEGCSGLTSITINCKKAGSWFRGLTSIKKVVLGENVTSIDNYAFSGCTGLASINIPNNVTSIGWWAFENCSSLPSITISEGVTDIGVGAFDGCNGLTSVTLNCKEVGTWFNRLTSIKNVVIGENVTFIDWYAFEKNSELSSITINCKKAGSWFRGLTSIKKVILGKNVTSIDSYAFSGCTGLTSINIPNSVTTIGDYAFKNCSGLTSIAIPNSMTSIGYYTFQNCSGLATVTLNCKEVSLWFRGLTSIKNIVLGDEVSSITKWAFQGCSGLTSITFLKENPFAFNYIFDNEIYNTAILYVPAGTTEIYQTTEGWKNFKNIVEMAGASIAVRVTDENGTDVTDKVSIVWYNAEGKEIGTGEKLNGVADSTEVYYSVLLDETMGQMYREVNTQKFIVSTEPVTCQLEKIGCVMLEGRVSATDIDKTTMKVNIKQMLNGKWEKTYQTQTNEQGVFQVEVYDDETDITISGEGYLEATIHRDGFNGNSNVGTIPVSLISGFAIAANITIQEASATKEVMAWTDGLNNIEFSLNNTTKGTSITDFTLQNGNVIIKTGADVGDEISLMAKSKQGLFADASTTFTIKEGANAFDLQLTELGGLDATCINSNNSSTVGYLYDSGGILAAKGTYVGDKLSLRYILSGDYTLVSMGNSMLLGSMTRLSDISATGLNEGTDYVTTPIVVVDGELTTVSVDDVPKIDEAKFYYTNNNTYFSANKASVTAGDYLILQAHVDFKSEYAEKADGVTLTIDLPEGCKIVENSVIANRQAVTHMLNENRLIISLTKEQYESQLRFCIIPTLNQRYAITAMASFDIDGVVQQPIGTALFEAKGLSLSAPTIVPNITVTINGTAKGYSDVRIFDNDVLVGKTTSKADGSWSAECELFKPYSHSFHDIYAKITTENGMELTSEVQQVEYDKNYNVPEKVMMTFYNGWMKKNVDVEFNLLEGTTTPSSYSFYHGTDFTFLADFTRNDTTQIKNVNIKVLNSDGTVRTLPATFDGKHNKWVATTRYSSASRLPQNVAVEYDGFYEEYSEDERKEPLLNEANILVSCAYDIYKYYNEKVDMTPVEDCEDYVTFECRTDKDEQPFFYRIEGMDYAIAEEIMKTYQFVYTNNEDGISGVYTEISDNCITVYAIDLTNNTAFKMMLYSTLTMSRAKINSDNIKNTVRVLKESVSNGQFLNGFLDHFGNVVNIVKILSGIKEYWSVHGDFTNMCDIVIKYSDYLQKTREETFRYIVAKCPDGNYKLTREKREQYSKAVQALDVSVAEFENQCYMYLDEYKNKLRTSVVTFIGSLGLGKAISMLGKSGKFINGKFNGVVNKFFNKHFSSHVDAKTTAGILTSLLGTSADFIQDKVDKIFNYKDFNSVKDNMLEWSTKECSVFLQTYKNMQDGMSQKYVKCGDDEIIDQINNNGDYFKSKGSTPQIDPSGYVYETVMSNRLEGVTTTCYQKVQVEDMYGDVTEEAVVWNAEDYSQENPLKTDATGFYRWDVPQGMWQVKYEKEGYETAYSDWLPVPPPQLDVNIGMKQSTPPIVKKMRGYESGITIETTKYIRPETMSSDNITVTRNGKNEKGRIELMNEEKAPLGEETYVSKVKFIPQNRFSTSDIVVVTVHKEVESYCGVNMKNDHVETVKIESEITSIEADSVITVPYQGEKTLKVMILPKEASAGKKLNVRTSSSMIASVSATDVTIDQEGAATLTIGGELPGGAVLDFTVDDTDVTATSKVQVKLKVDLISAPTANILSGETVDIGTKIKLYCETEDAVIYYTTDGSCPCDETTRKRYDGPIVIYENTVIKAMAVTPDMVESDVVEFVYTINDDEDTIIQVQTTATSTKGTYDISGRKVGRKAKGVIIQKNEGSSRKVLVK